MSCIIRLVLKTGKDDKTQEEKSLWDVWDKLEKRIKERGKEHLLQKTEDSI